MGMNFHMVEAVLEVKGDEEVTWAEEIHQLSERLELELGWSHKAV
jgi:hypothetical protein